MRANNQKSTMPGLMLGLILVLFIFHVLSPAAAQAASASEIDRDARASLAKQHIAIGLNAGLKSIRHRQRTVIGDGLAAFA